MYQIYQFDGLYFEDYLIPGEQQNMGTGAALTQFYPLPGGGFFDAYRSKRAPQGIRPITKSFHLYADTQADLRSKLDAIRAKIGVRGRLTIRYDDGEMRWQWARLQNVSAARSENAKSNFLPIELTWITAAQVWYGIVQGEGWTWGDETWLWGDGSAEFGQNSLTYDLTTNPQTITIDHVGNIDVANMRITINGVLNAGNSLTIRNQTTGQQVAWGGLFTDTERLEIDTGARSARVYRDGDAVNISSITKQSNVLSITTSSAHGLTAGVGGFVKIEGTSNFNGIFQIATAPTTTTMTVTIDPETYDAPSESTGTLRFANPIYSTLTAGDTKRWLSLKPGDNDIRLSWGTFQSGMSVKFEYYDHYA